MAKAWDRAIAWVGATAHVRTMEWVAGSVLKFRPGVRRGLGLNHGWA